MCEICSELTIKTPERHPFSGTLVNTHRFLAVVLNAGKCPNTEFFVVPIFSVFSPNAGKYGPGKTPYLDTFHAVTTSNCH